MPIKTLYILDFRGNDSIGYTFEGRSENKSLGTESNRNTNLLPVQLMVQMAVVRQSDAAVGTGPGSEIE